MDTVVPRTLIRHAGEGERFWFAGGGTFTMKATAAQTNGSVTLWEDHMVRGKVTPLHLHPTFEEAFYVLDGEILVHTDGQEQTAGAGAIALFPRGVPHAFLVTSDTAHILAIAAPGVGESFYRECSDAITAPEDADRPPDFDRLSAAAARSEHIELLGPPPFDRT
jgi:quercetin dioxygenase-like cupin family protein